MNTSKNGEWGINNFLSGKDDSLCLGSYKKEEYGKVFNMVKNALKDMAKVNKDNYFTIFVKAPSIATESVLEPVTESLFDFFKKKHTLIT